ncbi:MAG: hypothetical protein HFI95_17565 [Lachnospiraceae bacterium]|nr:hypothetical protein [Lachnospiraceae bacterium]
MAEKKEAEILARTFRDRMSVYRKEMRVNPETKESREVEIPVYENVICALSLGSMDVPQRKEFHGEKQMGAVIFTPPGIFLKDNDRAAITTQAGQSFSGRTGRTFAYISHGETPFDPEAVT